MRLGRAITAAVAAALSTVAPTPASAGPFALVGDVQLRADVDLLKAAGLIRGPVDSWPLPWAQIDDGLNRAGDGRDLPPHVAAAAARLERLSDRAADRFTGELRLSATNAVSVPRDFSTLARSDFDAAGQVEYNDDRVSVTLGAGYRAGQLGVDYHFEPAQVALRLGNWAVYGGFTETWFGPGQQGALLFSNGTRPFPKIGIKRLIPHRIKFPVLKWLGPIRIDFFGGVLNEQRDWPNTLVFGTRLNFEPAPGFEVGLNRAQMLCGQGRPCGFRQIFSSFVGGGTLDNATPGDQESFLNQAGNQIAGWDISYVHRFGRVTAKLYFEGEAEDFDNIILEQYARLVGATVTGPWGGRGAIWSANVEWADTFGASLLNGTPLEGPTNGQLYPRSIYNNGIYFSGFTYRERPIGHWTDGDSRTLSVAVALTDTRNRRWYASVRSTDLNISNLGSPPVPAFDELGNVLGLISYRVSRNRERFAVLTAGGQLPTRFGDIRVEGRYQTDSPNTPGRRRDQGAIEVTLLQRF